MARRGRLGMHLDRDRGICKLNNDDRRQWIDNDEGLYNWKRSSRQSMSAFIRDNKTELDRAICGALGVNLRGFRDGAPAPAPAAPKPAAAPAAAPVAGWWPFKGKKKQLPRDPRRMAQTIMIVPTPSGRLVPLRGAKRRRRR